MTINHEDILEAARAMTKEERLKLIAEIIDLPEPRASDSSLIPDHEVMELARQFSDRHNSLLRRLAQ